MLVQNHLPKVAPNAPKAERKEDEGALAKVRDTIGDAIHWLDEYSKPRPDTSGNLKGDSFFQAAFNGAVDGLYVFGPFGAAFTAGAAALGVGVQQVKPEKRWLGPVVGSLAGAGLAAGLGAVAFTGTPLILTVATGALLGGFEVFKSNADSKIRDSGNGAMITAPFLPGAARMSGGLAGMIGAHAKTKKGKMLLGAATGAATAGALTALSGGGLIPALAIGAVAGAAGPWFGPRYSQFFRNLAADFGKPVKKLYEKIHPPKPDNDPKVKGKYFQLVGTVPAAFIKEGVKAMVLSNGSVSSAAIGGVKEAVRQVAVVIQQKDPDEKSAPKTEAAKKPDP